MRPRFTLRLTLISTALLAAACYVLFVRPSQVAYRFVEAVNERDFKTTRSLLKDECWPGKELLNPAESKGPSTNAVTLLYAEVLPREWPDIWSFQRRFIFRVGLKDTSDGRHIEWIEDTHMAAFIDGVDVQRRE